MAVPGRDVTADPLGPKPYEQPDEGERVETRPAEQPEPEREGDQTGTPPDEPNP